jgi:hypothetical protein
MKPILAAVLLSLPLLCQAQPSDKPTRVEALCAALSNVGEYTAQGRANGVTEKQATAGFVGLGGSVQSSLKVIMFVYSRELNVKDAKKVVLINCLVGAFQ